MGVQVVLIPNIHMETPNYSITRVRNDDVTEETSRASYEMVELPSEIEEVGKASQEPKAVRLEAAVKGITPASPAPTVAARVVTNTSLFSRIRNWFGKPAASKTEVAEEKSPRRDGNRNSPRRNTRNNRNNRGGERVGSSERGPEHANVQTRAHTGEKSSSDRNSRPQEPRQKQQPRPEREKPQLGQPQATQQPSASHNEAAAGEPRSRRGRSGRRDRGPRTEQREIKADTNLTEESKKQQHATPAEPVKEAKQTSAPVLDIVTPAQVTEEKAKPEIKAETTSEKTKPQSDKVESTTAPLDFGTSNQPDEKAPAARAEKPDADKQEKKPRAPRRPKATTESKPVDLAASGLQLVETKAGEAKAEARVEPQTTRKPRKPAAWQQKASETQKDEPLVIVQTQK